MLSSLKCGGACPPLRGRFLRRPLEEPLRTGHARRGGGGVDAVGGRLRRPGPSPARSCALPSIVLVMPVQCAPPDRGDASVPPPHRATPAPTRLAVPPPKPTPHSAPVPPPFQRTAPPSFLSPPHKQKAPLPVYSS